VSAVDQLLTRLGHVDEIVDFASHPIVGTPQSVVDGLLRSSAIQALAALEAFVRSRAVEWSASLTAARVSPSNLPGGVEVFQSRLIRTFPKRYTDTEVGMRGQLASEFSTTLASFSTGSVDAHALFFEWIGSNMQSADVETILNLVGIDRPWGDMTALWKKIDPATPAASAKTLFTSVTDLRHPAAHQASPALPLANIQTLSRNTLLTALLIDAIVSTSIDDLAAGRPLRKAIGNQIPIRKLEKDGKKWSETVAKSKRAIRRHDTLALAIKDSAPRAKKGGELLIAFDGPTICDWRTLI